MEKGNRREKIGEKENEKKNMLKKVNDRNMHTAMVFSSRGKSKFYNVFETRNK